MRKGIRMFLIVAGVVFISGCSMPGQADDNSLVQQEIQTITPTDVPTNTPTLIPSPI